VVRDGSTGAVPLSVALTLARTVTAGLTTDVSASYEGLSGSGALTIALPAGMSAQSTVPSGATLAGGNVTFSGLSSATGSVRVRALVSSGLASGTGLPVSATISDTSGASGSAAGTSSVR